MPDDQSRSASSGAAEPGGRTSFWLDEPWPALPSAAVRAGQAEVAVIGGGVTGCSCALTLAERGVRVRLHERARSPAGRAAATAASRCAGRRLPYDRARDELGAEPARRLMALTEARARPHGAAGGRCVPPRRQPAAGRRRRPSGDELRARVRRAAEPTASRSTGSTSSIRRSTVSTAAAIHHPPDGALQPARWVRRLAAARGGGRRRHA